ncbi:hypothetical protein HOA55_03055 [archaeon]|jgi:hypothetical protein|nr:hypothetical protein [archaeon]MBT3577448.1 hypothetical protein [archaeon]MBT6820309.1 hypothetical protein [archaeon]MBT7025123.1 hypothetical protein [archaeon]MBT7238718.1 hypothetical protein [archaeon]
MDSSQKQIAYVVEATGLPAETVMKNLGIDFVEGLRRFAPGMCDRLLADGDSSKKTDQSLLEEYTATTNISVARMRFFREGSPDQRRMHSAEAQAWYRCHAAARKFVCDQPSASADYCHRTFGPGAPNPPTDDEIDPWTGEVDMDKVRY